MFRILFWENSNIFQTKYIFQTKALELANDPLWFALVACEVNSKGLALTVDHKRPLRPESKESGNLTCWNYNCTIVNDVKTIFTKWFLIKYTNMLLHSDVAPLEMSSHMASFSIFMYFSMFQPQRCMEQSQPKVFAPVPLPAQHLSAPPHLRRVLGNSQVFHWDSFHKKLLRVKRLWTTHAWYFCIVSSKLANQTYIIICHRKCCRPGLLMKPDLRSIHGCTLPFSNPNAKQQVFQQTGKQGIGENIFHMKVKGLNSMQKSTIFYNFICMTDIWIKHGATGSKITLHWRLTHVDTFPNPSYLLKYCTTFRFCMERRSQWLWLTACTTKGWQGVLFWVEGFFELLTAYSQAPWSQGIDKIIWQR